jgi:small-conductance mechanosensitive channel
LLWVFIGIRQRLLDAKDTTRSPVPRPGPDTQPGSAPPVAGPPRKPKHPWRDLVLSAGRLLAMLILATSALSYVALSGFVFHRFVLLMLFVILFYSARVLTLWALSVLPFVAETPADTTQHDQEKRRLGLWLRAAVDITLATLGVPAFVFVVGFGWLKMQSVLGLLDASVEIGAVSISFGNILAAVLVFFAITIGTRLATSITDKKILSRTRLDPGERNSIVMLVKYAGIVLALLIALAFAGVGLSRLAIVAGGLSVGIGLGLQGVVNNFVSGLILLFERPIKLGDWIKVSSGEGYVKHIGARATEIETFERASIIIPNADLVTSAVQNWFHKNRIGRVQVTVGVSYDSDPEQVRAILLDCAQKHASIMNSPPPMVIWKDFGDSSLLFELRAFIWNYDNCVLVPSDLRFAIFKALKDAGIEIPFPQRDLHIRTDSTKASSGAD